MSQTMDIGIDLRTLDALKGLRDFIGGLNQTQTELSATNAAVVKADAAMDAMGTAAKATSAQVKVLGSEAQAAGQKAAGGVKDLGAATGSTSGLVRKLMDEVKGLGLSYLSLQGGLEIMRQLREQTEKAVEARIKLSQNNLNQSTTVADLVDNLGLVGNDKGVQTAQNVVNAFRQAVPATAEQSVSILSQAQSTGYQVFNAASGKVDDGGMAIAAVVGKFASRTRLDASTAGKLFVIAKNAGVKTPEDMEKLLAQLEVSLQNTPIEKAADAIPAMIRAISGRMAQGVPVNQAIAQFGAAASSETSPEQAATNVQQLSRVAAGVDDNKTLVLAKRAETAGILDKGAVKTAEDAAMAVFNKDHGDELDQRLVEAKELEAFEPEAARREKSRLEDLRAQLKKAKTPQERKHIEEQIREAEVDAKNRLRDTTEKITRARAEVAQTRSKAQTEAHGKALVAAYKQIPIAQREQFLNDTTKGMSPGELSRFAATISEGDMLPSVVTQLGPAAQAQRQTILDNASNPAAALPGYRDRTSAFIASSPLAVAAGGQATSEQEANAAAPAGGIFANEIYNQAEGRVGILTSRGGARTGIGYAWQSMFGDTNQAATGSLTANGVKMQQVRKLALENLAALWNEMPENLRAQHKDEFNRVMAAINSNDAMGLRRGVEMLGALRNKIRNAFQKAGMPLPGVVTPDLVDPQFRDPNTPAPAATVFPGTHAGFDAGGNNLQFTPPTAPAGPKQVSYSTVHIGNVFSASSDLADLGGRLEGDA